MLEMLGMLSAFVRASLRALSRGQRMVRAYYTLASQRLAYGGCGGTKFPRKNAPRAGALAPSTRVARSLLILKSAFRRNAQAALRFYDGKKLWFTSSTWGGWCFAVLLLAGVVIIAIVYLSLIPKDADTIKYLELYAVIVIGLMSLYIAGSSFWAKQGSAFFVEYQTAKDMNVVDLFTSSNILEDAIGNPANSTMPYVKRIYIRNEKNKHEAIKRILLQLPNEQTLVLKEYKKADALLIKPYEAKVLKLNAVTFYFKEYDLTHVGRGNFFFDDNFVYTIKDEEILRSGKIIVETAQGQSCIKNNNKPISFCSEKNLLKPSRSFFGITSSEQELTFGFDVICSLELLMKKNFADDKIFNDSMQKQISEYPKIAEMFYRREGELAIQIVINLYNNISLSYFFQAHKKKYTLPVHANIKKEFYEAYKKHKFFPLPAVFEKSKTQKNRMSFFNFYSFCDSWAEKKWGKNKSKIYNFPQGYCNQFAVCQKETKIIDDLKP